MLDRAEAQLSALLDGTLEQLDIPQELHRQAVRQYHRVARYLGVDDDLSIDDVAIYPQGSFRLGTVVLPIGRTEYDIDLVFRLALDLRHQARRSTSARMSGTWRRESGIRRRVGSSQAMALISTTSSGGKDRRSAHPGTLLKPGESLLEEPLAPLRDDLPPGVQAGGDLVIVEASGGKKHDLGPHYVPIRQRIAAGSRHELAALILAQLDGVWAPPRHRLPLLGGKRYVTGAPKLRYCNYGERY